VNSACCCARKLIEEVAEFLASDDDPQELADILEVLFAPASQAGLDRRQLEHAHAIKEQQRGGFARRIVWYGNRPASICPPPPLGPQAQATPISAPT